MNSELLNAVSKTVTGTNVIILPGYGKPKIESDYAPIRLDIWPKTAKTEARVMRGIYGLEVME